jgi:CrcB protein
MNYLIVSLGAALGGGLRYWIENIVYKYLPATFPYGTMLVNVIGSFILGLLMFHFDQKELLSSNVKIFLTVGFCGGFTTFSSFSYETMVLFRDSQFSAGLLNIFLSLILSFAGLYLAYLISRI